MKENLTGQNYSAIIFIVVEKMANGLLAQLVEHIVHIDGVTGSSPVQTTTKRFTFKRKKSGLKRAVFLVRPDISSVWKPYGYSFA